MSFQNKAYSLLLKRIGILLLIYSICRILFYFFNRSFFTGLSFGEIASSFFLGIRFDITAIVITNTPIILLHFLPEKIFQSKIIRATSKFLFLLINSIMILLNAIDFSLFQFTAKRATTDVFKVISFGHDFTNTLPKMIGDFWYVLLILFALWYAMQRFYPTTTSPRLNSIFNTKFSTTLVGRFTYLSIFLGLFVLGFRGGIQFKPLTIISATQY